MASDILISEFNQSVGLSDEGMDENSLPQPVLIWLNPALDSVGILGLRLSFPRSLFD